MPPMDGAERVQVHPANAEDAERLVDWILAGALESEGVELERGLVETGVATALADPLHRQYYVAERENKKVGCSMVTTEWSDWKATWYWWLQSIYIEKTHRGRENGVLDAIIRHVHEAAREAGAHRVCLYVHKENKRAVRAYEKRGYQLTDYLVYERLP